MIVIYAVSIPGLLLWALGVPFLGLYLVKKFRRELEAIEYTIDPKHHRNLMARFKLRLGFLTQGYREEYYYWEIVLLLRKTILVLLMTFIAPISAGVQTLAAIMLLIFSLIF